MSDTQFGLYIHIPFCSLRKCFYCDFYSVPLNKEMVSAYIDALKQEMLWVADRLPKSCEVSTIYCGGGTPSILTTDQFNSLYSILNRCFTISPQVEWTMEANPESFNGQKLQCWISNGVNRISLGIQSFNDYILKILGRIHTAKDARSAIDLIRNSSMQNWSMDLMCGIPKQTKKDWTVDLKMLKNINPPHISIYPLSIEPGTPLEKTSTNHMLDDDIVVDMLEQAENMLEECNYNHYEIANYCLIGYQCDHNIAYWKRKPYLGLGPTAASFWHNKRITTIASLKDYCRSWQEKRIFNNDDPFERPSCETVEKLSPDDACRESIILGTRLLDGFSVEKWLIQFGDRLVRPLLPIIDRHVQRGLLKWNKQSILLTKKGRWLANNVWRELL